MARKAIRFIQNYIAQHQDDINSVAHKLGVPPMAIAAAISEEMSHVYFNTMTDLVGTHDMVAKNQLDAMLDDHVQGKSDADIRADFENRRSDIENGIKPSVWSVQKLFRPTANDIGPANLNLGSAILTLKRYLADPANAADPLNLQQYANDYQKFARDIIDLNNPATIALAGLHLQRGVGELTRVFGPNFTNASEVDQAALLTTFFKQGAGAFLRKHPDPNLNGDSGIGGGLGLKPGNFATPDPSQGDGAPFVIDNFQALKNSLSRKQGANDLADPTPASRFASSGAASPVDGGQASRVGYTSGNAISLRAALEQRGANLGIAYGAYMPIDALLAEIHSREGAAAPPQAADATADRIEHEMDTIGAPLVAQPDAGDPPPLGLEPFTRASLDQRAARFGLRFGPAVPDDQVLTTVHVRESDGAPPAAADAFADRIEREMDGTLTGAGIPWVGGEDDVGTSEVQA